MASAISVNLNSCLLNHFYNRNNMPISSSYVNIGKRIASFNDWPWANVQNKYILASCGFFYVGNLDTVQCFSCGQVFQSWQRDEDPWVRHALQSKTTCQYLVNKRGVDFITDEVLKNALLNNDEDDDDNNTDDDEEQDNNDISVRKFFEYYSDDDEDEEDDDDIIRNEYDSSSDEDDEMDDDNIEESSDDDENNAGNMIDDSSSDEEW